MLANDEPCWAWLTTLKRIVSSFGFSPHHTGLGVRVTTWPVWSMLEITYGPYDGIAFAVYPVLKAVGSFAMAAGSTVPPNRLCQSATTELKVTFTSNSSEPCSTEPIWSHPVVETTW